MTRILSYLTRGPLAALFVAALFALTFTLAACVGDDENMRRGSEGPQASGETARGPDVQPLEEDIAPEEDISMIDQSTGKSLSRGLMSDEMKKKLLEKAEIKLETVKKSVIEKQKVLTDLEKGQTPAPEGQKKKIEKLEIAFWVGGNDDDGTKLPLSAKFCKPTNNCPTEVFLPTTSIAFEAKNSADNADVVVEPLAGYYAADDSIDEFLISSTSPVTTINNIEYIDDLDVIKLCIGTGNDPFTFNTFRVTVNHMDLYNSQGSSTIDNGACIAAKLNMALLKADPAAKAESTQPLSQIVAAQKAVDDAGLLAYDIAGINPETDILDSKSVLAKLYTKIDEKEELFKSTADPCYNKQVQELNNREFAIQMANTKAMTAAQRALGHLIDMKIAFLNAKDYSDGNKIKIINQYLEKVINEKENVKGQKNSAVDIFNKSLDGACTAADQQ